MAVSIPVACSGLIVLFMGAVAYTVRPHGTWRSGWGNTLLVVVVIVLLAWRDDWLWLILLAAVPAGLAVLAAGESLRNRRDPEPELSDTAGSTR